MRSDLRKLVSEDTWTGPPTRRFQQNSQAGSRQPTDSKNFPLYTAPRSQTQDPPQQYRARSNDRPPQQRGSSLQEEEENSNSNKGQRYQSQARFPAVKEGRGRFQRPEQSAERSSRPRTESRPRQNLRPRESRGEAKAKPAVEKVPQNPHVYKQTTADELSSLLQSTPATQPPRTLSVHPPRLVPTAYSARRHPSTAELKAPTPRQRSRLWLRKAARFTSEVRAGMYDRHLSRQVRDTDAGGLSALQMAALVLGRNRSVGVVEARGCLGIIRKIAPMTAQQTNTLPIPPPAALKGIPLKASA